MNTNRNIRSMKKTLSLIGTLVVVSLLMAACATALPATQVAATQAAANPTAAANPGLPKATNSSTGGESEAEIKVATDPALGQILVDGKGMTLYMFTNDTADKSNCDASCLEKWPPLLTKGAPKADDGVDKSMIGSTTTTDGRMIVTYNHMPLYYFVKDTKAGDTQGQDVGSVWFVVSPDGKIVGSAGAASPTTAPAANSAEATINVSTDPALGQILVDGKGMTLYMFTKDAADQSNCDATCLEKWPPFLTLGNPVFGTGVDDSKVGTTTTTDGRMIVTYNHMPLYYFVKDTKAGDTQGQNVGSVWFVVSPDGKAVGSAGAASPTTALVAGSAEATINVATDPALGQFLVDGKGMTLYMFTRDTADKSNCDAACLEKWPPFLTLGSPVLGTGVDDSKVGTSLLADGTLIVTYNHMPLYYYIKDLKAGDTTGQGVGSVWYVVSPDGEIIR